MKRSLLYKDYVVMPYDLIDWTDSCVRSGMTPWEIGIDTEPPVMSESGLSIASFRRSFWHWFAMGMLKGQGGPCVDIRNHLWYEEGMP